VEGLKLNFVSVVDSLGNLLLENSEGDLLVGLTIMQLTAWRNLEQYLAKKAESMLEKVLGPGQAIVRVSTEINFDTITRTEEKFDPDGQVVKKSTKNEETLDSTTSQNSPAIGMAANTATETNTTAAATPVNNSRTKKNTGDTEYEISKTVSNIMQSAGGLKHLSAAVTVAARFEGTGAERKMVPRAPEDLEKLRRIVQSALGVQTGEATRNDQITLEELPFNDRLATDLATQFDRQRQNEFWWNLGLKAIYPLLAVAVILLLLRLLKRTPTEEIPVGIPLRQIHYAGNGNGNGHGSKHGPPDWGRDPMPGVVTVEVLNQLIKENPGNMTQAIRGWLARGKATSK
jgi:flagellar M-ring protein FliF